MTQMNRYDIPQVLKSLLTKQNVIMDIFAREQKHGTTVFEVCLITVDGGVNDQHTIALKALMGTLTDQTDLFF